MKRATFARLAVFGLVLSLVGVISYLGLGYFLHPGAALQLSLALLGFAYICFLIAHSEHSAGRLLSLVIYLSGAATLFYLAVPHSAYLIFIATSIWMVRVFFLHRRSIAAICDAALLFIGMASAVWALAATGSLFLAFWCFFLIQALVSFIPAILGKVATTDTQFDNRIFQTAYQNAENAINRL